jgi:hypothetical protein
MYSADRAVYREYGATVVAWGDEPTLGSLDAAAGAEYFASVGLVTEFARYHDRFPRSYADGLCRDVRGEPFKVPWLADLAHRGIPYWWCCTGQPQFRQFVEERVADVLGAGAHGVHVDDHLGSAGALSEGGCFCDRCVEGFRAQLTLLPAEERERLGAAASERLDVRALMGGWLSAAPGRRLDQHPLWGLWSAYHCRAAASFARHLRAHAARCAGREVPMAANAVLLEPNHLVDYRSFDFFSSEVDHRAREERLSDVPLVAYRLADALDRPLASTATGPDWAFVKAHDRPGLVRGWIALAYAAGHHLMAPHRQWCYTPDRGTHWYEGPSERLAPLYRFVRAHLDLFDGYETWADVAVVLPHRSFLWRREPWLEICGRLSQANVAWRIVLGGDELVSRAIEPADLAWAQLILNADPGALDAADRERVRDAARRAPCVGTAEDACSALRPAVRVGNGAPVRILPRVKPGAAVIHVVNWGYRPSRDQVEPLRDVALHVDLQALGLPGVRTAQVLGPDVETATVGVDDGRLSLPGIGQWTLVTLRAP